MNSYFFSLVFHNNFFLCFILYALAFEFYFKRSAIDIL